MTELGSLAAGFTVGILGSVHCVGMCGGIAAALAFAAPGALGIAAPGTLVAAVPGARTIAAAGAPAMSRAARRRGTPTELARHLLYGLGRVTSYALAGAVAGAFGSAAAAALGPVGTSLLRAVAAALIVVLGLYLGGWWTGLAAIERAGAWLWRRIAPAARALRPASSMPGAFALGMLWGWLPCGLVYSALALAATAGDAAGGAALMIGFGAGTVPAVLGAGLAAARIGALLRASASRQVAGAMVVALGVWTLLGSGLWPLPGVLGTHDQCAGHADPAVPSPQSAPQAQ